MCGKARIDKVMKLAANIRVEGAIAGKNWNATNAIETPPSVASVVGCSTSPAGTNRLKPTRTLTGEWSKQK